MFDKIGFFPEKLRKMRKHKKVISKCSNYSKDQQEYMMERYKKVEACRYKTVWNIDRIILDLEKNVIPECKNRIKQFEENHNINIKKAGE